MAEDVMCFVADATIMQLIMYVLSWIIRSVKGGGGGVTVSIVAIAKVYPGIVWKIKL